MRLSVILGCLLSLSPAVHATVNVPITDRSPSGCPLASSGTVTIVEHLDPNKPPWQGVTGEWTATNSSGKAIVATVTTELVHYSDGRNAKLVDVEDFFWDTNLPTDKVREAAGVLPKGVHLEETPLSTPTTAKPLRPPSFEVIVEWVQFDDGTTWGDNQNPDVQNYVLSRRRAVEDMRRLANVYGTQGPEQFVHEIEELRSGSYAYHLRTLLEQGGNPQLVIEKLRMHLRVADARARVL